MEKPKTMKLCVQCRHFSYDSFHSLHLCAALEKISLVTGTLMLDMCDLMRGKGAPCGPDGKLWEIGSDRAIETAP